MKKTEQIKRAMKDFAGLEGQFFDIDEEKKIAHLFLEFEKPSDIFDANSVTKTPVLSDDFLEWFDSAFSYTPDSCRIDLTVSFHDLEGYDEQELSRIFRLNTLLEAKKSARKTREKNRLAFGLIALGALFFGAMLLMQNVWSEGGFFKEMLSYVADIATTVLFWEAATILLVENKERRDYERNLLKKFSSVTFRKKEE